MDQWPGKWLRRFIIAVMLLITVMTVALFYYRFTDAATASDQRALQERQDCARVIANEQAETKDALTIAKARLDQAYVNAQLSPVTGPEDLANRRSVVQSFADRLDEAIKRVENLPPTQTLVDRRCPSVGE